MLALSKLLALNNEETDESDLIIAAPQALSYLKKIGNQKQDYCHKLFMVIHGDFA